MQPGFLTLEDVSTYLSVSVPQVYALVRSGELPAIKIGGRGVWRVGRRQLDAYVERLHDETRDWAQKHPLNPKDKA
ncbi:MAG TPA: helix-turn-helix domain-containing protein [Actinomycetota bacterium]|nr:helix-turn-helix domain-containing protein [Actinomycetota bacterium]